MKKDELKYILFGFIGAVTLAYYLRKKGAFKATVAPPSGTVFGVRG